MAGDWHSPTVYLRANRGSSSTSFRLKKPAAFIRGQGMPERFTRALIVFWSLLLSVSASAQTDQRSAIEGVVRDPQGALVAGATVMLSGDRLIGGDRTTSTDKSGYF